MQTVELSMIVRNGGGSLARCLGSARSVVDRIIVGDTGSTDDTAVIARQFGAEVFPVAWQGDFSLARNAVLREARCDWILVLDADEMLNPAEWEKFTSALHVAGPAAYEVWRWNYVRQTNSRSGEHGAVLNPGILPEAAKYPAFVSSLNTRLFRRDREVYFERPVHETVAGRLGLLGRQTATAPFTIHHFGHVEEDDGRDSKNTLYQEIGAAHLRQHPGDARTCFELGLVELEHKRSPQAALTFFLRAADLDPRDGPALLFAGVCLVRLQRFGEAIGMLSRAAAIDARSVVLHETLGDAHFHLGDYAAAGAAYDAALTRGSGSALVLAKHGVCEVFAGRREAGVQALREAVRREPAFRELRDVAAIGAMLAGEEALAAEFAPFSSGVP